MDESVGKGPGVENEVWQSLPKLDASGVVADDFALASAGPTMTSGSSFSWCPPSPPARRRDRRASGSRRRARD